MYFSKLSRIQRLERKLAGITAKADYLTEITAKLVNFPPVYIDKISSLRCKEAILICKIKQLKEGK